IIVTSRNRVWDESYVIDVPSLSSNEYFNLLITQLKFEDNQGNHTLANRITKLCDGLPLVILQVIADIRVATEERKAIGLPAYTMEDYLSEINDDKRTVQTSSIPADSPFGAGVFRVYKSTLKILCTKEHGQEALRCLSIMALLNPDNIPTMLLIYLLGEANKSTTAKILVLLHKQNVITRCKDFYKIHRVIQHIILYANQTTAVDGIAHYIIVETLGSIVPLFKSYLDQFSSHGENLVEVLQNGLQLATHVNKHLKLTEMMGFLKSLADKLNFHGNQLDAEIFVETSQ
ncbi:unnamed protein product, partial [Allacma fusca]